MFVFLVGNLNSAKRERARRDFGATTQQNTVRCSLLLYRAKAPLVHALNFLGCNGNEFLAKAMSVGEKSCPRVGIVLNPYIAIQVGRAGFSRAGWFALLPYPVPGYVALPTGEREREGDTHTEGGE